MVAMNASMKMTTEAGAGLGGQTCWKAGTGG